MRPPQPRQAAYNKVRTSAYVTDRTRAMSLSEFYTCQIPRCDRCSHSIDRRVFIEQLANHVERPASLVESVGLTNITAKLRFIYIHERVGEKKNTLLMISEMLAWLVA